MMHIDKLFIDLTPQDMDSFKSYLIERLFDRIIQKLADIARIFLQLKSKVSENKQRHYFL